MVHVRGDWEFMANTLGLQSWANKVNMCWLCSASNSLPGLLWHDMSDGAGWRATRRTHESYLQDLRNSGAPKPFIFDAIVGLSLPCMTIDVLHAVDLGVTAHLIGNILMDCVKRNVWQGRSMKRNVELLDEELSAWCKQHKVESRIRGHLTMERLRSDKSKFPKLKAKGAATRHLMGFVLNLAQRHCQHDKRIVALAQLMSEFYTTIHDEAMYMTATATEYCTTIGRQLCAIYAQLSNEACRRKEKVWKAVPKFHLFAHLCEWQIPQLGLNPRYYWCYADEDLVGSLIETAQSCHPASLAAVALTKWMLMLFSEQ